MTAPTPERIALSLVAHTNVGKTTLARTLLQRDIGEVRDEPHVTVEAERHLLIESTEGDRLELWDTPGFGDSLRLAQRIERAGNPIGWFLNEVWDRWREPALWASQRAVRNVLEQADVVLYLANAAEQPEDVAYLDAELRVLTLIGKPVLVLLNQTGAPRGPDEEAAELQRWRVRCAGFEGVRTTLALDAFARCWVQEGHLLEAVGAALAAPRQAGYARLQAAWTRRAQATWHAAIDVLAAHLANAALDREPVPGSGWAGKLREVGELLGLRRAESPREQAMQRLAARLDAEVRSTTDRLIRLHGLGGQAAATVLQRLAEHYALRAPLGEGKAAVLGGLVSGALAGLKADIATGGLTLGGGLLAGGVLGALGAAGLARGYNLVRGRDVPMLSWADVVLDDLLRSALLAYLAVAHFGRGRGEWVEGERPGHWAVAVDALLAQRRASITEAWAARSSLDATALQARLAPLLTELSRTLLLQFYPGAGAMLAGAPATTSAAGASR